MVTAITDAYCGIGCQNEYGTCNSASKVSNVVNTDGHGATATSTVTGRCGDAFGGACSKANQCCSKYGYCGTSNAYCGNGCQPQYGICN